MRLFLIVFILTFYSGMAAYAQTIPVGMPILDESLRTLQLQGKLDLKYSLSSRPFFTDKSLTTDSIYRLIDPNNNIKTVRKYFGNQKGVFELLPLTFESEFNSHHPYGWNHAGMIDAKGIQGFISTGFFASYGPLSVQFKPEAVYAANPNFEYSSQYGAPTKGAYHHVFAGQSSIRLNVNAISFGISSENMWWGPGIQNSLLMSNNAPGFLHLTLNTTRPIKTAIGNFEFQLIGGKLTEDTSVLLENKDLTTFYYAQNQYAGLPADPNLDSLNWRYINALTISYNPKWIKGLFLAFNRVAYIYHNYLGEHNGFIYNYLPVFTGLFRSNSSFSNGSPFLKQIISVNGRYVFQKAHAEIYAEYGWNDNTQNLRDFLMSPNHASAYTVGFKKMFPISNNKWIDFNTEITQLAQPNDYFIRTGGYWYLYQGGFTNQSRIIGTGIGMGNNIQTLTGIFNKGLNKSGIIFQRLIHDPIPEILGIKVNKWEDISTGVFFEQKIMQIILKAEIQVVSSKNYAWKLNDNTINVYGLLNIIYNW